MKRTRLGLAIGLGSLTLGVFLFTSDRVLGVEATTTAPSLTQATLSSGQFAPEIKGSLFTEKDSPVTQFLQAQSQANFLANCANPAAFFNTTLQAVSSAYIGANYSGMSKAFSAACTMTGSLDVSCPKSDPPIVASLTCATFSPQLADFYLSMLGTAACGAQCKKGQAAYIKSRLNCVMTQIRTFTQEIKSLNTNLQENLTRMKEDMTIIDNEIANKQAKVASIDETLNGTGTPAGLNAQIKTIQTAINGVATTVKSLSDYDNQLKTLGRSETTAINAEKSRLTMSCFSSQTFSEYQCAANGPSVSLKDYIICIYRQRLSLGSKNDLSRDSAQVVHANSEAAQLEKALTNMINAGTSSDGTTVQSLEKIEEMYLGSIPNYTFPSVGGKAPQTLLSFIKDGLETCSQRADSGIVTQQGDPSSKLGQFLATKTSLQNSVDQTITSGVTAVQDAVSNATSRLRAQLNLDMSACKSGELSTRISCFNNSSAQMNAILTGKGNTTNGAAIVYKIPINGSEGNQPDIVECSGLQTCANAMSNRLTSEKAVQAKLGTLKKNYTTKGNTDVQKYILRVSNDVSSYNKMLMDELSKVNKAVSDVVGSGVPINTMQGQDLPKDSITGLPTYNASTDMVNLVSKNSSPGILDISRSSPDALNDKLTAAEKTENSSLAKIESDAVNIVSLKDKCTMEEQEKDNHYVKSMLGQISGTTCYGTKFCDDVTYPNLANTISYIDAALFGRGQHERTAQAQVFANLATAKAEVCKPPAAGQNVNVLGGQPNYACNALFDQLDFIKADIQTRKQMMGGSSSQTVY